jgi:copper homeostasis protein
LGLTLEIVCASAEDCAAAERGGANRIELVSAIEMGGLTPSAGCFQASKARCRLPIIVMLRPRTGGFCFTDGEFETMKLDARQFWEADGYVTGILQSDGRIDQDRCRELMMEQPSSDWVFHRAFDVTPDPFEALETLISLGFKRLLTSGQKPTVEEGVDLLKELVKRADGRIEILPGSGLNKGNLQRLAQQIGVDQVHATAFENAPDSSTATCAIPFNGREIFESGFRAVKDESVKALALEASRSDAGHDVALSN